MAPPSNKNEDYVATLKEQSLQKKTLKTASKSGNKRQCNACSNYATHERTVVSEMTYTVSSGTLNSSIPYHERTVLRTHSVTNRKKKHFRTYSRRALYDLPKLSIVIELVLLWKLVN